MPDPTPSKGAKTIRNFAASIALKYYYFEIKILSQQSPMLRD